MREKITINKITCNKCGCELDKDDVFTGLSWDGCLSPVTSVGSPPTPNGVADLCPACFVDLTLTYVSEIRNRFGV